MLYGQELEQLKLGHNVHPKAKSGKYNNNNSNKNKYLVNLCLANLKNKGNF